MVILRLANAIKEPVFTMANQLKTGGRWDIIS